MDVDEVVLVKQLCPIATTSWWNETTLPPSIHPRILSYLLEPSLALAVPLGTIAVLI